MIKRRKSPQKYTSDKIPQFRKYITLEEFFQMNQTETTSPESTKKIQWHPGFYAAAEIELREDRSKLEFHREYNLSKKPLQIDLLIIEKLNNVPLQNELGAIFRRYNIIEYKSPDDRLNIDDFFKTIGYAFLYKGLGEFVNQIPLEELTVSLFHEASPALKMLTQKLTQSDLLDFMECANSFTEPGDRQNADAVLQVSVSANKKIYDQVRRNNIIMCEALRELFKDELEEAHEKGKSEGMSKGENRLKALYAKLEQDGRREEIFQSLSNPEILKKLYDEYGIE